LLTQAHFDVERITPAAIMSHRPHETMTTASSQPFFYIDSMGDALKEFWSPPNLDRDDTDELIATDPRVITDHMIGVLPCPNNPPPPDGWRYWRLHEAVPPALVALATKMLNDGKRYPMGTFVQTHCEREFVGARVEWHDTKGATGENGCFRGVSLMRPSAQ
jgi:hypothetical protein